MRIIFVMLHNMALYIHLKEFSLEAIVFCVVVGGAALSLGVVLRATVGNAIGYCYVNNK